MTRTTAGSAGTPKSSNASAVNCPDRARTAFSLAGGGAEHCEHCGADNGSRIVDYIVDWAAERLGASPAGL